ncbi:MAG: response regulator transcription factor [Lachnospiraceae bacterium]|nr:response regulator transcription factor [Lachnospiraceae bacterium]
MINVMVVEDQAMPRQLFEMIIKQSEHYKLVYSIESAGMAEVYCMSHQVDLILMDVCTSMGESGLEAAERIKKKYPEIKIIIVTSMPECSYIDRAKAIGVESFWYKDLSRESILDIMDRTMAGESVYPLEKPEVILGLCKSSELTERELEVLRELTSGDSDALIADRLHMSVWTVRSHIKHMMDKTGFDSRTKLAVAARESGIVILGF